MTTSRIVRGTKGRVFLYICAVLFVTGLIACYNNVRVQLDETHKQFEVCRQEQEHLNTQLQVIYDYKQRLEKSLKTEKGDHQRTKHEFETKLSEDKSKNEKIINDAKLRFSTLQQHYNLLKTQREDLKEECSKIQKNQLDEINHLQSKLKEVQEELKRTKDDKESSVQHLKTKYDLLKEENARLKEKSDTTPENNVKRIEISSTNFSKIINDGEGRYVIGRDEKPSTPETVLQQQPEPERKREEHQEEFKNVLALPSNLMAPRKSSTPKTPLNAEMVVPLKSPTLTPETPKKSTSKEVKISGEEVLPLPYAKRKVPKGFVPVPAPDVHDEKKHEGGLEETNAFNSLNNRYRGSIFDAEVEKSEGDKIAGDKDKDNMFDFKLADFNKEARKNMIHHKDFEGINDPEADLGHLQEEDDDAADGDPMEHDQQDPAIRD